MNSAIFWMIVGMGAVTYIPRMLPLVVLEKIRLPGLLQNILQNVPFAILGALIFPGVLFIHDEAWYGLAGAFIAFLLAYFSSNVIVVVIGSIVALSAISLFM